MQSLFREEVCSKIREIRTMKNEDCENELKCAVKRVLHLADLSSKAGLASVKAEWTQWKQERNAAYLQYLTGMAAAGMPEDMLELLGMMKYCTSDLKAYDGLTCLIYLRGMNLIQRGEEKSRIEQRLMQMLPEDIGIQRQLS